MFRPLIRLIGYIILAPFFFAFALFFGLPFLLAVALDESFEADDYMDVRFGLFFLIFAIVQNSALGYIAYQVFK